VARAHGIPLFVGSGATAENADRWAGEVHGVIVSSTLRKGGRAGAAFDLRRAREFARAFRKARRRRK
jgi:predicted TIM-barrel enzyme